MSKEEENQKDLINLAFAEFAKAINDARNGKAPIGSYNKLKKVYDALAEAEKKRSNKEISDEEMEAKVAEEVQKLKQ